MSVEAPKRLFTIHEYYRMGEAGILTEDDRVELIEGEIVQMTPMQSRHAGCVTRIMHLLVRGLRERAIVTVQNPVRLGPRSEPQPDLAILRSREDFYASRHPGADDVLLLIEVASTSRVYDRQTKVPLYARCGIPEVWLVDLIAERLEAYRDPAPTGYGDTRVLAPGQRLAPMAFPDLELDVGAMLGK